MDNLSQNFWDPISEDIGQQSFTDDQKNILKTLQFYEKYPYLLKFFLAFCSFIPLIALYIFVLYALNFQDTIQIFVWSFVPVFVFYRFVKHMQEEIILYLLCKQKNWPFTPHKDYERPQKMIALIPDLSESGHDLRFEDQVWGTTQTNNREYAFWTGEFQYVVGYGRNRTTYTQYIFVFKLPKAVPINF